MLLSLLAGVQPTEAGTKQYYSQTKRGSFSLIPTYGQSNKSILNQAGQSIGYTGTNYGLQMTVKLADPISLYAETRWTTAKNSSFTSEELSGQGYSIGIYSSIGDWLEFGVGYGGEHDTIKATSSASETVTSSAVSTSIITHLWDISESFGLIGSASYRIGIAAAGKSGNSEFNSGATTIDIAIGLRWSPTVTFTYTLDR